MKLEGIHHITGFTADAQRNLDFYAGVLGLRFVKKSVNQDHTSVYHLFYADEVGDPGCDITFFEYPGIPRGRAGDGMVHRIIWRLGREDAVAFWVQRLNEAGADPVRIDPRTLRLTDPEGLEHELSVTDTTDEPLTARHPEIPGEFALQGFDAVRAYARDPDRSRPLLEQTLGFTPEAEWGNTWECRGDDRGGHYRYDPPPEQRALQGAGTIHHVAWASHPEDQNAWQQRVAASGAHPTHVIDRHYFRSIYFREPSGVLFEIATIGPGFTVDEPLEHLGEKLSLTPKYEHLRAEIEPRLTPLHNPRDTWVKR
jgi:glyoxalase family protein